MDPWAILPQAVTIPLLRSLDIRTIISCEQVCSFWYSIVSKPTVWKKIHITEREELPKKWETIKGVLQLPKFSLQSSVDLRYLCHSKSGDGSDAIGPGEVIKFITSGSVLRHLSSLDLSRCSFLTTEQIMNITQSQLVTSLKSLSIAGCSQLRQPEDLAPFATLTSLTYLNVASSNSYVRNSDSPITPRHLAVLSTLTNLTSISFWHCTQERNEELYDDWENLKFFPKLQNLNATTCSFVHNKTVECLAKYCTRLSSLNISATSVDGTCFQDLIRITTLTTLNLWCSKVGDSAGALGKLPNLTWLNIGGCHFSDSQALHIFMDSVDSPIDSLNMSASDISSSMEHIGNMQRIQTLNLSYCFKLEPKDFKALANLPQLRNLTLRKSSMNDEGLYHLRTCVSIQVLILGYCDITDAGLEHISKLTKLESLNAQHCAAIGDPGISHLTTLGNMRMLYLGGCTRLTDLSLERISFGMKYLRSLNLGSCDNVTDVGLSHLGSLVYLAMLDLCAVSKITDEGLRHVSKLSHLHSFTLTNCGNITEEGVKCLQSLPLVMINLAGCNKVETRDLKFNRFTRVHMPAVKPLSAPKGRSNPRNNNNNNGDNQPNNENNNNNEDAKN